MSSQSTTMLVVLLVCCCLSSAIAGGLWGTNVLCDTTSAESQLVGMNCASVYESSGSSIAARPVVALSPKQTLLNSGQMLQGSTELEIGTAVVPLSTQPDLPTTGTYSISMDLNFAGTFPRWKCILNSSNGGDWVNNGPAANTRRPLIGATGTDAAPANQMLVNHSSAENAAQGDGLWTAPPNSVRTNTPTPIGTWFNFTVTMDSSVKKGILYINGSKISEFTAAADFAWPSPSTTWTWGNDTYDKTISVKVKNAYFFKKALTAAEVSTIGGTTSTYMPQPLSMGTSAYVKETYMPY